MADDRLPLTRTSDVRLELTNGARIVQDKDNPRLLALIAADGTVIPAWQNALRTASTKPSKEC